jgi:formate dehydrogenase subunit delta
MPSASTWQRSTMSPEKLVYMANQIGKFFANQGEEKAVAAIADHVQRFWEPRMRAAILEHLDAGGAGLDPFVYKALASLNEIAKPL